MQHEASHAVNTRMDLRVDAIPARFLDSDGGYEIIASTSRCKKLGRHADPERRLNGQRAFSSEVDTGSCEENALLK
jgi:hypothetical protein